MWRKRKRLEESCMCVSFLEPSIISTIRMVGNGVRVGPVTQFIPGGWMNGTERDDVILDLISGSRCSQLSQLRPVDPKFLVNRRTLVHPEPFYRLWMNFPHMRFPAPRPSRKISTTPSEMYRFGHERYFAPSMRDRFEKLGSRNIAKHFTKYIVFEWMNSLRTKEKRKISHMENICLNGALRELVYGSVIISSHRNVHRLGIWIEFIVCSTNKFLFMLFFRQEISSLGIVWTMICTLDDYS